MDYEGEIVVALGKGGSHISEGAALGYVAGYGVGIDVTARDLQGDAKKKGQPWAVAKGYDTFAVLGDFVEARAVDPANLAFTLSVNGIVKQKGNSAAMEHSIAKLIAYLSTIFSLAPGDLIYTGTPEGVGPLAKGDRIQMELGTGLARLEVGVS